MPMVIASRRVLLLSGALALAGCTSTTDSPAAGDVASAAAPAPQTVQEAPYCPQVTLRENTTILDKPAADGRQAYVASITDRTRDCRVENGQLRLSVGIKGKVVPGVAAPGGTITLPVRVAVLQGDKVVYSRLGRASATIQKGAAPGQFTYVDNGISVPQPTQRNLTIFAGFDEGPEAAGRQLAADPR